MDLRLTSGRIVANIGEATLQSTAATYSDGADHDVEIALTGGTLTLLVDGVVEDSSALAAMPSASKDIILGPRTGQSGGLDGVIKAFSMTVEGSQWSVQT